MGLSDLKMVNMSQFRVLGLEVKYPGLGGGEGGQLVAQLDDLCIVIWISVSPPNLPISPTLSFCILIHYFRHVIWKINKNCNILLLKALRARPVWVLVIASAFPRCKWPTPIYWLIWLIRWWCGDGGDQLAGKSINWIQFWVRSSGETNWICGTGRPGAAVHREIGGSSQWWQDDAQLGQRENSQKNYTTDKSQESTTGLKQNGHKR